MVGMGVEIKETGKMLLTLIQGFNFIRHTNVYVGIPQEANGGHGKVTNAELLYIHSNGSPAHNIPPRPTIEPAISNPETAKAIQDQLIAGIQQALTGNLAGAEASYNKAGMIGASAAQAMFGSAELAPLKPATIAARERRTGKKSTAPLIDTGALRAAVTYVVRKE